MRLYLILLMMGAVLAASADYELTDFLKQHRGDMWSMNQSGFGNIFFKAAPFIPTDQSREELRYALSNRRGMLRLDEMTVFEALAAFGDDKTLDRLTVTVFNRGDGGHWGQENVTYSIDKITALLKEYYPEVKPVPDYYNMSGQKIHALNWKTPDAFYQLKWSMSGSKSAPFCEYFILNISKEDIAGIREAIKVTVTDKADLRDNIRTDKPGYRYLDIAMVDQGNKGYCVVAVLERILRYYGSEADQHQLAQLTNTEVSGTTRDDMLEAIRKADNRLGIRMRELYSDNSFYKPNDFLKMVDDYNKTARKARRKTINPDDYKRVRGNYYHYEIGNLMKQMEADLFVQSRGRERREVNKFIENIKKNVDTGVPLGWCVLLGLVPEKQKNPQAGGGHMRLIIGYNDAAQELVFTDSWGLGHEFKTMSYSDAWAMTTWLGVLLPRTAAR
jgi:hypothetical protein